MKRKKQTRISSLQMSILTAIQNAPKREISTDAIELLVRNYAKATAQPYSKRLGVRTLTSLIKKPFIELITEGDKVIGLRLSPDIKIDDNKLTFITANKTNSELTARIMHLENDVIKPLREEKQRMKQEIKRQASEIERLKAKLKKTQHPSGLKKLFSGS
ncbi:MAG: hypothetical protein HQM12_23345 [SAR324 cluster bacterium]|nr:hypothetical protein [SAR324 cluster bacterium]